MNKNIHGIFSILLLGFMMESCTYNNEAELYPCDSLNVTYSKNIEPIIRTNCYRCHSNANAVVFATSQYGPRYLEGYDSLKKFVDYGVVLGSIKHLPPPYKAMPKGAPKLSDCDIAKIEKWINEGAPNN
jgi:hypothetical protein